MAQIAFPALGHDAKFADEKQVLDALMSNAQLSDATRTAIAARATALVTRIRTESHPTLMEHFLAEYGLSTREGVALMCLAEAMLRVPDTFTMDAVRSNVAGATPLRREGQADEVADAVAYLASSEASFITGANVDINGGLAFS